MFTGTVARLYTQEAGATFNQPDLRDPERWLTPIEVEYGILEAVGIPTENDIERIANPLNLSIGNFALKGRESLDTISLDELKAIRLAEAFKALRPDHQTDCHDFLTTVQGWTMDRDNFNCSQAFLPSGDYLEPGEPYAVIAKTETSDGQAWQRVHSCLATDCGNLLSVLGLGHQLTILDPETTLEVYGGGAQTFFSRAYPPEHAKQFPYGVVPTTISVAV